MLLSHWCLSEIHYLVNLLHEAIVDMIVLYDMLANMRRFTRSVRDSKPGKLYHIPLIVWFMEYFWMRLKLPRIWNYEVPRTSSWHIILCESLQYYRTLVICAYICYGNLYVRGSSPTGLCTTTYMYIIIATREYGCFVWDWGATVIEPGIFCSGIWIN